MGRVNKLRSVAGISLFTLTIATSLVCSKQVLADDRTIDDYLPESQRILCQTYGEEFGISEEILESILFTESSFDMDATNGTCKGIAQINTSVHGDYYDTEEKQVQKMCELLTEYLEDEPDMAYALDRYNGNSKALYNYENGIISDYSAKVFRVSEELEAEHGKKNY